MSGAKKQSADEEAKEFLDDRVDAIHLIVLEAVARYQSQIDDRRFGDLVDIAAAVLDHSFWHRQGSWFAFLLGIKKNNHFGESTQQI